MEIQLEKLVTNVSFVWNFECVFQLHNVNQSITFFKRFYPENTVGFRKCTALAAISAHDAQAVSGGSAIHANITYRDSARHARGARAARRNGDPRGLLFPQANFMGFCV